MRTRNKAAIALLISAALGCSHSDRVDEGRGTGDGDAAPVRYHLVLDDDGTVEVGIALRGTLPATVKLAMCAAHPANGADLTGMPAPTGVVARGIGGHELEFKQQGRRIEVARRGEGLLVRMRLPIGHASPLDSSRRGDAAALSLATLLPVVVDLDRPAEVTIVGRDGETPDMTSRLERTADGRGFRAANVRDLVSAHIGVGADDEYRLEAAGRTLFVAISGTASASASRDFAGACRRLAAECESLTGRALSERYHLHVDCGGADATAGAVGAMHWGRVQLGAPLDDGAVAAATVLAAAAMMQSAVGPPRALATAPLTAPVRSRDFWITDGVARYLAALACLRADVVTTDAFLAEIAFLLTESDRIAAATGESVLETAAKPRLPLISGPRLARPASSPRGAAAAFAIDLELRGRSGGGVGLEDALRRAKGDTRAAPDTETLLRAGRAVGGGELATARGLESPTPDDLAEIALGAGLVLEKVIPNGGAVDARTTARRARWHLRESPGRADARRALLLGSGSR